jgi:hypothetical protein
MVAAVLTLGLGDQGIIACTVPGADDTNRVALFDNTAVHGGNPTGTLSGIEAPPAPGEPGAGWLCGPISGRSAQDGTGSAGFLDPD